jgi:hypothetical protein
MKRSSFTDEQILAIVKENGALKKAPLFSGAARTNSDSGET